MTDTTAPDPVHPRRRPGDRARGLGCPGGGHRPGHAHVGLHLWKGQGDQEVGIWECTPGPSRWLLETHEFIQVVAGRMTVTVDGGGPLELAAGDTAVFPKGWSGTWDIAETLRKVYVIF